MKKLFALGIILIPVIAFASPAPQAADYNISVHVTQSRLIPFFGTGSPQFIPRLDAVIDGKKVQLVELRPRYAVLHTGDYKARIEKTGEGKTRAGQTGNASSYEDEVTYELLLTDGTKRQFMLVGEQE
jgi:hypothetical protein